MAKAVTQLLLDWQGGDAGAGDELFAIVYGELRQLARSQLRRERSNHTLQPTALVHELFLRLTGQHEIRWQDRAHFFGIAARLLRQILVDHARGVQAAKRGGDAIRIPLESAAFQMAQREVDLVRLDDALIKLSAQDQRQCEIVELRFFGGLSIEETAVALGCSPATVKRDWTVARAWLYREIAEMHDDGR